MTVTIENLKVGDVILPPERELRLWMRRHIAEKGMSESALYLTITEIKEGARDKKGRWIIIKSAESAEWTAGQVRTFPFTFKARPGTPWPLIARKQEMEVAA